MAEINYHPKKFAVIGAGPVGGIVAAFLAKGGYDVTLCDIVPELLAPALDPGIILEGVDNLQAKVTRTTTRIDDLIEDPRRHFHYCQSHGAATDRLGPGRLYC